MEDPGTVLLRPPGSSLCHAADCGMQPGLSWTEEVSGDPAQVAPGSRGAGGVSLQPPQVSAHIQVCCTSDGQNRDMFV